LLRCARNAIQPFPLTLEALQRFGMTSTLALFLLRFGFLTRSEAEMKTGVFIPIGNNGWLISENAPQYRPSFALNKPVTLTAGQYGLDFVLPMIKLRGFGGKTEFRDHNLESFTLMAGLAAVTKRIKLFATCPALAIPPAIAARMSSTTDSISDGRFGLNLITGWQKPARFCIQCGLVKPDVLVEIASVAHVGKT